MDRLCKLCAAGLAVLTLWGCHQQQSEPTIPPTTVPTQTTAAPTPLPTDPPPPETIPPITEPPLTETPPTLDPVTELSCTQWVTFPQLLSLGDGKLVASRNYYDKGSKSYVNSLQLLDIYADTILHEAHSATTLELVQQRFPDGKILVADPHNVQYHVYDADLTLTDSFDLPVTGGYFSYDRTAYFYLDGGCLFKTDLATGDHCQIPLAHDLRLERLVGIHPTEDLLIARAYRNAYTDNTVLCVLDPHTGNLRLLSDKLSHLWATGDTFYGVGMNATAYGFDVYTGTFSGDTVTRLDAALIGDDQMGWSVLPGSHYLVRRYAPDEDPRNTQIFDLKNGTKVDLDDYGYIDCTFSATWLYEEQLIFGFYEKGDYFIPVLLDPKAMTFQEAPTPEPTDWPGNVDQSLIDRYIETTQGPTLDPSLDAARTKADQLAQCYGIHILIAQQTQLPCTHADHTAEMVCDPAQITAALDTLETALSKYPQDFFAPFRTAAPDSGIYLCLTGAIQGDLPTTGFAELLRDRHILGLDITSQDLEATFHHELWHAIESHLSTDRFDTEAWQACNPTGFKYYGKYDSGYLDLTKWTYSSGSGTNSHFIDSYARISPREDRAQIWEALLTGNTAPLEATSIAAKLEIMLTTMERTFPTAPWTE